MIDIPQEYTDLLRTATVAHVATIGPKGEPHNTPVWFDWDGTYIRFSQTKTRQKFRNLERDPRLALSIVDQSNPYHTIEIRGRVMHIEEDTDMRFLNTLTKRYLNRDTYPWDQPGVKNFILVVEPEYVTKPRRSL